MLPGLIAGNYTHDEVHIDLGAVCRSLGVRFIDDRVTGLDLETKTIQCEQHPSFSYDVLSIDIGSSPDLKTIPGAKEYAVGVKPVDRFLDHWQSLQEEILQSDPDKAFNIGIVGGGASSVEVALAMQYKLRGLLKEANRSMDHIYFHVVSGTQKILPSHNEKVRKRYQRVLDTRKVKVHHNFRVSEVQKGAVHRVSVTDENHFSPTPLNELKLDKIIWAISASAPEWPKVAGLACSDRGFIQVDACLQSTSHPGVFACGDIADVLDHPRPKAGVFAVRQGKPLAVNLEKALFGQALQSFTPQTKFLSLVSTGDKNAVASRGNWALSGALVWYWKDSIDRKFMRRFSELAKFPIKTDDTNELEPLSMRCGGCGAKVGQPILNRVIAQLSSTYQDKTTDQNKALVSLSHPDDAAVLALPSDKLLVQSVDAFRRFIDDDYLFGQIAANHALGDIFAMGATPHSAQALVTLPFASEEKVEQQLLHLMLGASKVFDACEMPIVGGHTAEGVELSLGFTVNGLIDERKLLTKGGLRPGDKLILTKSLGTGALFAADMRGLAKGVWVKSAIDMMLQSNQKASQILFEHGAEACTDVTGFGLAGHLVEMLQASKQKASIDLQRLPVLEGTEELMQKGLFSTLHQQNKQIESKMRAFVSLAGSGHADIIFDPQTAGGLLVGVPAEKAETCLKALRDEGYRQACIIGEVIH
jgi:selenide,water dikinase